jgi:hypothetical protein
MSYSPFMLENNNSTTGLEISLKALNLLVQKNYYLVKMMKLV